ncbi:MAG: hypothetical protein M3Q73_03625 [bacterium]|nr:hypothetical protein [bacterium]
MKNYKKGFAHMFGLLIIVAIIGFGILGMKEINKRYASLGEFFSAQVMPIFYSPSLSTISPPTELKATLASGGVNISWKDNSTSPNEQRFEVHRFTQAPVQPYQVNASTYAAIIPANITTYADDGSLVSNTPTTLTSGTTYYYAVRATDAQGLASKWSNVVQVKYNIQPTLGALSGTYNGITFQVGADRKVMLNWKSAFTGTFTEFRVKRTLSKFHHPNNPTDLGKTVFTAGGSSFTYTDTPVQSAVYEYEVRAKNALGVYTTKKIEIALPLTDTEVKQIASVVEKINASMFGSTKPQATASLDNKKEAFTSRLVSVAHAQTMTTPGGGAQLTPYVDFVTMLADNYTAIDSNGDGVVTDAEITAYMTAFATSYMNSVDIPFGAIIKNDILGSFKAQQASLGLPGQIAQINAMYKAFIQAYKVGLAGLPNIVGPSNGANYSKAALQALLNVIDTNGDGILSDEEMDAYWNNHPSLAADTQGLNNALIKFLTELFKKIPEISMDGSCHSFPTSGIVGSQVIWSFQSANPTQFTQQHSLTWIGTDGLSGSATIVNKVYTKPGVKYGHVITTNYKTGFKLRIKCPAHTATIVASLKVTSPSSGTVFLENAPVKIAWTVNGITPGQMSSTKVNVVVYSVLNTTTGVLGSAVASFNNVDLSAGSRTWTAKKGSYIVIVTPTVSGSVPTAESGVFSVTPVLQTSP